MLSFKIIDPMNQTVTLNIIDTTTMLITLKIIVPIPYVTDNPLPILYYI